MELQPNDILIELLLSRLPFPT